MKTPAAEVRATRFTVGNEAQEYSLVEMLDTNADDEALCGWLLDAKVGDVYPDGETCKRVA